ncbi:MAG: sigma-54-dependent Fis family transcriptional regulator, partial [Ignavibacteria bacterium]|nr:sigma-54-dependent Fis family transcriptional regulator [Ignavibacteria bacterium]
MSESKKILMVDDEVDLLQTSIVLLRAEGYEVDSVSDGIQGINAVQTHHYDLVLLDIKMPKVDGIEVLEFVKEKYPSIEAIMLTGVSDLKIAVECMNKGAFYYILKPFNVAELLQTIKRALEHRRLLLENSVMRLQLSRIEGYGEIIGESAAFRNVLEMAQRVAASDSSVLLQGASGTGKEVVANFIYKKSLRVDKPFIALNCASIPDSLIESELFGYEKGAFTDARTQKQGLVELANGGTLFLDEIGDISPVFQPKLLRFIQTGEYRRIGGNTLLRADVRVFSASNKDLREEVRLGRFREDLLYRLNVITIVIPPLKE